MRSSNDSQLNLDLEEPQWEACSKNNSPTQALTVTLRELDSGIVDCSIKNLDLELFTC